MSKGLAKNYGLDFTGITGIIIGTEVDKSNKTMNIQGILEVSGSYKATMEIRNLRINNKSDNSNCAKLESLENQSDTEKWFIRIKYENPKTTQEMSAEFNASNKEQKKILLESLLQNREPGAKYSYLQCLQKIIKTLYMISSFLN